MPMFKKYLHIIILIKEYILEFAYKISINYLSEFNISYSFYLPMLLFFINKDLEYYIFEFNMFFFNFIILLY